MNTPKQSTTTSLSLPQQTLEAYLDSLASSEPTPGGGCSAALVAAQGLATLEMAYAVTVQGLESSRRKLASSTQSEDTKETAKEEFDHGARLGQLKNWRKAILELAVSDTRVFDSLMAAYRLPRGTEEDRKIRSQTIQNELTAAAKIPQSGQKLCLDALQDACKDKRFIKDSVLSDYAIGLHILKQSVASFQWTVECNLQALAQPSTDLEQENEEIRKRFAVLEPLIDQQLDNCRKR